MEVIPLPKELIGITTFDEDGNRILKKGATEEQKRIFQQFYKGLESGKLSDVELFIDGKNIITGEPERN